MTECRLCNKPLFCSAFRLLLTLKQPHSIDCIAHHKKAVFLIMPITLDINVMVVTLTAAWDYLRAVWVSSKDAFDDPAGRPKLVQC